jgi:Cof subfamily protein (haloacid dehalogenase superfamily)
MVFVLDSMPIVTRDRYDAFLLDLDGTLLDGRGRVGEATRAAVSRLVDKGYAVFLATGRSPAGTRPVHETLALETEACCYNGCWIGDLREARDPFHYAPIPDEVVPHLEPLERLARHRFRHHRDHKYTVRASDHDPHRGAHRRIADWFTNVRELEASEAHGMPSTELIRVSVFFEDGEAQEAAWTSLSPEAREALDRQTFPMSLFPDFEDVGLHLCEVQRKGRGKAEAFRLLRDRLGVPPERVVAAGDQRNDLPLLAEAGLALAMSNSMPEVFEVADLVVGDHRTEALARWLDENVGR